MENLNSLTLSLYSSKDQWPRLISNCILPFFCTNQPINNLICGYSVVLKKNIQISLLVPPAITLEAADITQEYFTEWFSKNNNVQITHDFANGSINFYKKKPESLFSLKIMPLRKFEGSSFNTNLSRIILSALKDEVIDDETLITLAYYLHVGLIKAFETKAPGFKFSLKSIVHSEKFLKTDDNLLDKTTGHTIPIEAKEEPYLTEEKFIEKVTNDYLMHRKYEEEKTMLLEILNDITNIDTSTDISEWIKDWDITCQREVNKASNKTQLMPLFTKLSKRILRQLALNDKHISFLTYYIHRVYGIINPPGAMILGAQKCGTSTLHQTLISHPNIRGATNSFKKAVKEVDFFHNPQKWRKGVDWYFSHFTGKQAIFLDSSPNYIIASLTFERIRLLLPNIKLIICLRNPVKRAYSQYNHYRQVLPNSHDWDWYPDKSFTSNVKTELENIKNGIVSYPNVVLNSASYFPGFLLRGTYMDQISELLKYFDRSQIHIIITEKLQNNYKEEMDKVLLFLGLQPNSIKPIIVNKREYTVEPFEYKTRELLKKFFEPHNRKLYDFLGYEIPEWS